MAARVKHTVTKNMHAEDLKLKLPVSFSALYGTMSDCAAVLIDATVPHTLCESCYAVLSVKATVYAYTLFLVAACADYKTEAVCVSEKDAHIVLSVTMTRRRESLLAGDYAPFASKEEYLRFCRYVSESDLSFSVSHNQCGFVARFAFVRFRADRYAASSIDTSTVGELMYQAILEYNGEK